MRVLGAVVVAFVLLAAPAWGRSGPVQLGTALNSGGLDTPAYLDAVRRYDAVTPESALKLAELQPARGQFDFAFGDRMVDWARENGVQMHGTTLIWCDDSVLPGWLSSRTWTRAQLLPVMREHITRVMDHFAGRVPAWDVVNEAFGRTGARRDCLWQRAIGDDWIEQALRAARAAVPSARLFYNETAADFPNAKFGAVEAMATDFKARGVPLDGVGLQYHLLDGSAPLQFLSEDAMRRLGALGLAVHVSELDAFISQFGGTLQEGLDRQAQAFQTIASACQAVEACFRITLWGAADHWSWRGTEQRAVALDSQYREKPGWWGIREAIRPATPAGRSPSPPGRPVASAAPNAGVFGVSWAAASEPDGEGVSYVLEHRDADDAGWATVASGIRSLGFSFVTGRLERQGTYRYRVRASDGRALPSAYSEESGPVAVDRTDPAPPAITPDRAPDGGGWYRKQVTLSFAGAGDPPLADGSAGSGVDPATVPAPSTYAVTGTHAVSGIVRDRAGNASRSATVTVQVDADAPTAALTCPGPVQRGAAASAAWTASDPAGSGLAGPPSGSLPLDTSRAGPVTVTYTAADVAGNTTPASCTYVVEDQPDRGPEPSPSPSPSATPSPAPGGAVGVPLAIRPAAPRLGRASRVGRDGRVRVALTCAATCSGRVSLHAGGRRIAARRFAAAAGRSTLVLRLPRRERAALARRHRLAASLRLAPDSGAPSARRVTLRRR